MHNQLYHVTHQFGNLAVLYDVMDKRIRALNSGVNDKLRDKARAIYLLSLHLETVLWFLHGRLLPEADEGEIESPSLPYPRLHLDEFYRSRKAEVESLSSTIKSNEVLLIEQLIPSSVVQLWVEERGKCHIVLLCKFQLTYIWIYLLRFERIILPTAITLRFAFRILETRCRRCDKAPYRPVRLYGFGVDLRWPSPTLRQHFAASDDISCHILYKTEHNQGDSSLLALGSPEL